MDSLLQKVFESSSELACSIKGINYPANQSADLLAKQCAFGIEALVTAIITTEIIDS